MSDFSDEHHVHPYRHGARDHNQLAGGVDFVELAKFQRQEIERLNDELAAARAEGKKLRDEKQASESEGRSAEVAKCFIKDEPLLHFLNVMHLMEERYEANGIPLDERGMPQKGYVDIHDRMFSLWPDWLAERQRNDSYWHLYRHWIPDEDGKTLWDLMCLELGIEQDIEKQEPKIVFWVSW